MYQTEIRGFTAEDDIFLYPVRAEKLTDRAGLAALLKADGDMLLRGQRGRAFPLLCRITVHAMGARGARGIPLAFAKFCRLYQVEPRFLSLSDMGISFFVPKEEKERVLDALCAFFPLWE